MEHVRIPLELIKANPEEIVSLQPLSGSGAKSNGLDLLSNYSSKYPVAMDKIPELHGVVFPSVHHAVLYAMGKDNLPTCVTHDDFVQMLVSNKVDTAHDIVMGYINKMDLQALPGSLDDDVLLDLLLQKLQKRDVLELLLSTSPKVLLNQGGLVMGMEPFQEGEGPVYLQGLNKLGKLWMALRRVLAEMDKRKAAAKKEVAHQAEVVHQVEHEKKEVAHQVEAEKETAVLLADSGRTGPVEAEKMDTAANGRPAAVPPINNGPPPNNKQARAAPVAALPPAEPAHNNEAPGWAVPVPARPAPAPASVSVRPVAKSPAALDKDNKPVVLRIPPHAGSIVTKKGAEGASSSGLGGFVGGDRKPSRPDLDLSVGNDASCRSGSSDSSSGRRRSSTRGASSRGYSGAPISSSRPSRSGGGGGGGGGGGSGRSSRSRSTPAAPVAHGESGQKGGHSPPPAPKGAGRSAASPEHTPTALIHFCALALVIFFL
jgi:predicted NAD-dependent protein-ADP-ribosyltransferase YbiA (DUF1768 family)